MSSLMDNTSHVIHCHSVDDYYVALEQAGAKLVVVDCYAEWCPPCQHMSPIFDQLSAQYYPDTVFLKIDMDKVPTLKSALKVYALPTFSFLRDGDVVGSFMGANERLLKYGLENDGKVSICNSVVCSIQ